MDVSNGAGCDRGIRFDACSDLDVGGEEIFFSCCLFSAMAPERVLPSPPSDGGLLRGEEVVRDEILEVVGEGGGRCDVAAVAARRKGSTRAAGVVRWPSWARSVRPLLHLAHPRRSRWGGMIFGSPKPLGGKIVDAASLLAAEDLLHHC